MLDDGYPLLFRVYDSDSPKRQVTYYVTIVFTQFLAQNYDDALCALAQSTWCHCPENWACFCHYLLMQTSTMCARLDRNCQLVLASSYQYLVPDQMRQRLEDTYSLNLSDECSLLTVLTRMTFLFLYKMFFLSIIWVGSWWRKNPVITLIGTWEFSTWVCANGCCVSWAVPFLGGSSADRTWKCTCTDASTFGYYFCKFYKIIALWTERNRWL